MYRSLKVAAVIPALNEAESIGNVVSDLLGLLSKSGERVIGEIIVCDNGSQDKTAQRAREAGAIVVTETQKGYGAACLAGIAAVKGAEVILFVDADQSARIAESLSLLDKIALGHDLVIGERASHLCEPGSMTIPQRFGNWLACALIRLIWRREVNDLGPFRAIRLNALQVIDMQDQAFGWTVEMQVKAIQHNLSVASVPVSYLRRAHGKSKISGTVLGVLRAGYGILSTILRLALSPKPVAQRQNH